MATKLVRFTVLFEVDHDGDLDAGMLRTGIEEAIGHAMDNGFLTPCNDESTLVKSVTVWHESTL